MKMLVAAWVVCVEDKASLREKWAKERVGDKAEEADKWQGRNMR